MLTIQITTDNLSHAGAVAGQNDGVQRGGRTFRNAGFGVSRWKISRGEQGQCC
jgi:hypothetical protein